jgi:hypothetical protein
MDSSKPVGLDRTEAGINPVWRKKETEDPEASIFFSGVARSLCATAEPPEAAFRGW